MSWQVSCLQHSWTNTDENAGALQTPVGLIAIDFVCILVQLREKEKLDDESIWDFIFLDTFEHDSLATCPDKPTVNY